jgi:hypothetical protein
MVRVVTKDSIVLFPEPLLQYYQYAYNIHFFLLERPYLFAICNNTFSYGGKGEGWHVEEYSVALLC